MKKEIIVRLSKSFEETIHIEQEVEYWMARDLQGLFEYSSWENFLHVIEKAKTACSNSKLLITSHFRDVMKMVNLGSGTKREILDLMLSRFACYLIAQNGDSRKESIAFAQSYFALQTRKQELLEQHIAVIERLEARDKLRQTETELSSVLYQHGVDDQGFARIRSRGDQALFGGSTTIEMKRKLSVPESRALADFLPTITIKAKDFAGEITHFNVKREDLRGEDQISEEHVKNNQGVRRVLIESNIYPEKLPAEEDIKKLQKRIKKEGERLVEHPGVLPSGKSMEEDISRGQCKGIIFDFNGVLLWDSHLHEKAWIDFSKELCRTPLSPEEFFTHVHGKTNKVILEYLLKRPLTAEELSSFASQKESLYRILCLQNPEDFQLSPGATDLLDFLVQNHIPHTIATASEKDNVDFFIRHLNLDKWFDLSKIVYDDGTFVDKTGIYKQAVENLNLQPQECLVIEDSKPGIIAASRANIGKIIGLGPKETHPFLMSLDGVVQAVTSLDQVDMGYFQLANSRGEADVNLSLS